MLDQRVNFEMFHVEESFQLRMSRYIPGRVGCAIKSEAGVGVVVALGGSMRFVASYLRQNVSWNAED